MATYRGRISKYAAITTTNLQHQLAYVWETLSRTVMIVIFMFIFVQLWTAVFEAEGSAEIGGLTLASTIWYFLFAEMMELGRSRHDTRITAEVKDGTIAYTLLRPYNYLGYHFFHGLGETLLKMLLVLLLGSPVVLYYAGRPMVELWTLPPVLLVIAFAIVIDFCVFSMIGLLAFLFEDTFAFRLVYQKLVFILGGLMIPLDFLPDWLQTIARVLPFNLTTYAPARLLVAFDFEQWQRIVGLQIIWLTLFAFILYRQYSWATRRLEINGG